MDRSKLEWNWMVHFMPGVVAQVREWREAGESEHINECWRRGVLLGEPGWFFAREGPVTVGAAFVGLPEPQPFKGAVLMLRPFPSGASWPPTKPRKQWEGAHGTD